MMFFLLFLMSIIPCSIQSTFFDVNQRDLLIAIINDRESSPQEKETAQKCLAFFYTSEETPAFLRDCAEALKIYYGLLENSLVSPEDKYRIKLSIAQILSGGNKTSIIKDYIRAIQLYNEIIQDSTLSLLNRAEAQYLLASLYAGCDESSSVKDLNRAKELLEELRENDQLKNTEPQMYTTALYLLPLVRYAIYFQRELPDSEAYALCLFEVISDYQTIMMMNNIDAPTKWKAKCALGRIYTAEIECLGRAYLTEEEEVYLFNRGIDLCNELIQDKEIPQELRTQFSCILAGTLAFKENATQKDVNNAICVFKKALNEITDEEIKENLIIGLQQIREIDVTSLPLG